MLLSIIRRLACSLGPALFLTACAAPPRIDFDDRSARVFAATIAGERADDSPTEAEILAEADLDRYLRFGLRHHAGLRQGFANWRAAVAHIAQQDSLPDPTVTFAWFLEEIQTRTGPQERRYGISQQLPWFGTLARRGDAAAATAEALWFGVQHQRLEVLEAIRAAYHEYAFLGQSIRITTDTLTLLRGLEPTVQSRVRAGAGQEDILRLQLEIGRVEDDLRRQQDVRRAASARLAAAMNYRGPMLPLPAAEAIAPEQPAPDPLLERAAKDSPRLLALRERIQAREHEREVADLARWPNLTIGADYIETGRARAPNTRGSGDDPLALRVGFSVPIWAGKNRATVRAADHALEAARQGLHQATADLRAAVELGIFELADATRQITLYRDTLLPRARELMNVTRVAYRTGKTRLLDLIDSERTLLDFERAYWRAIRDYQLAAAHLQTLIGGSIQ